MIDWRDSQKLDSINEYQAFIKKWPSSRYAPKAKKRLKTLYRDQQWRDASATDSFSDYETFLRLYPLSPYTWDAYKGLRKSFEYEHELRVKGNWGYVQKVDTVAAYVKFLIENPNSLYITNARKRLETIGKAPLLEAMWEKKAMWEKNNAKIKTKKKKSGKQDVYALMMPVISDDGEVYLVV